jgi:hypothetical protein
MAIGASCPVYCCCKGYHKYDAFTSTGWNAAPSLPLRIQNAAMQNDGAKGKERVRRYLLLLRTGDTLKRHYGDVHGGHADSELGLLSDILLLNPLLMKLVPRGHAGVVLLLLPKLLL